MVKKAILDQLQQSWAKGLRPTQLQIGYELFMALSVELGGWCGDMVFGLAICLTPDEKIEVI